MAALVAAGTALGIIPAGFDGAAAGSGRGAVSLGAPLPRESDALRAARRLLPDDFIEYETSRYVVLSDAGPAYGCEQSALLERAHHQFRRFCRRLQLEPEPLKHKLVAVLFEDRDDYQRFARRHDQVEHPALSGYYSPRHDRVVSYRAESNPSVAEARATLARMRSEVDEIQRRVGAAVRAGDLEQARTLRDRRDEYHQHLVLQSRRVDEFTSQTSTATTVHEAIHQLMFHTGVQSRRLQYPLWICEGLATAFETDAPHAAFGPDHEHAPRRDRFDALHESEALLPLEELVSLVETDSCGPERTAVVYHQSYALVVWLCRFRAAALRDYLAAMQTMPPGRPAAARHLEIFEQAFGDVDELERAWRKQVEGAKVARVGGG